MLVLNTKQITKNGGLYNLQADQNLSELKSIMKDLIVKDAPSIHRAATFSTDNLKTTSNASTQTDSSSTSGGRVWAYGPRTKKSPKVKTFAL